MGRPQEQPIGLEVTRTAKVVSRAFDQVLTAAGSSLPTWLVLVSLKGRRDGPQRELAQAVGIEGPTLTHHLNRMESDGLVTRRRHPANRRIHQVELTPAGEDAFFGLLKHVSGFDQQLRSGLTDEEITALRSLLGRLRTNVTGTEDTEVKP